MKIPRLELALILGIVFFCCWCAYIILSMNSSVSLGPTPGPSQANLSNQTRGQLQQQQANLNYLAPSAFAEHQYQTLASTRGQGALSAPPLLQGTNPNESRGQLKPPYSVILSPPNWTSVQAGQAWPRLVASRPYELSGGRWTMPQAPVLNGYYPNQLQQQGRVEHWVQPPPMAANNYQAAPSVHVAQLQENQTDENQDAEEPEEGPEMRPTASSEDDQDNADNQATESPQEENQSGPNNEHDSEPNREFEEQVGRRSFSEDQSDANERDRNGQLVSIHRKHLINGVPVLGDKRGARGRAPKSSKKSLKVENVRRNDLPKPQMGQVESSKSAFDFDKLVNEIEQDQPEADGGGESAAKLHDYDENHPIDANNNDIVSESKLSRKLAKANEEKLPVIIGPENKIWRRQTNESSASSIPGKKIDGKLLMESSQPEVASTKGPLSVNKKLLNVGQTAARGGAKSSKPMKSGRDKHEHRLQESLTAQQWDDDSTVGDGSRQQSEAGDFHSDSNSNSNSSENETENQSGSQDREQDNESGDARDPKREMEEEPEEIEFKDLDLLVDSDKFPFMDSQDRRRRRRRATEADFDDDENETSRNETASGGANWQAQFNNSSINNTLGDLKPLVATNNFPSVELPVVQVNASGQVSRRNDGFGGGFAIEILPEGPNSSQNPMNESLIVNNGREINYEAAPAAIYNEAARLPEGLNFYGDQQEQQQQRQHYQQPLDLSAQPFPPSEASNSRNPLSAQPRPVEPQVSQLIQSPKQPATSDSYPKKKTLKYKKKRKRKESKAFESKQKAAKAYSSKKKSKFKKGGSKKRKNKNKKKLAKSVKEFKSHTEGKKAKKGHGNKGSKKGALFYKDKGYKKKGFKKNYQKLETGDHKTYFDEFRDKDHSKNWKDFKDKHHYSQSKKWTGKDKKKYRDYKLKELKDKKHGYGNWNEKSSSKHAKSYKANRKSAKKKSHKKLAEKEKKKKKSSG